MNSTLIYSSRKGDRVRRPLFHGDEIFFEVRSEITRIVRLTKSDVQSQHLPDADPAGSLLASDGNALIYLTSASTLVSFVFGSGQRQALCTLTPTPCAVVVTPECVVWCSAHTGDSDGEVWRWWRDTDRVEQLGTHESARPLLAVRPVPLPFPPERITTDIAITADRHVGLIDVEGVDWIAEVDEPILHLACRAETIVAATEQWVVECDLDTERCERVFAIEGPPLALVSNDDRTIIAHDCALLVDLDGETVCQPPANVYEIRDGAVRGVGLDGPTWVRGRMALATGLAGAILVEDGGGLDDIDRVTYLPHDRQPFNYFETLQIQRWVADGRGIHVMIEGRQWWCGMAAGELEPPTFRKVNRWLASTPPLEDPVHPGWRGWRISFGDTLWFCHDDDLSSEQSGYIRRLVDLLAPHLPALASAARLDGDDAGMRYHPTR